MYGMSNLWDVVSPSLSHYTGSNDLTNGRGQRWQHEWTKNSALRKRRESKSGSSRTSRQSCRRRRLKVLRRSSAASMSTAHARNQRGSNLLKARAGDEITAQFPRRPLIPLSYSSQAIYYNSNVFTHTPGEPAACSIVFCQRSLRGSMARCRFHSSVCDTSGCSNSYTVRYAGSPTTAR